MVHTLAIGDEHTLAEWKRKEQVMLKELIIKVDNEGIHLSPQLMIPIGQTNIPIAHCRFRTQNDIYWKVELLDYNADTKCWKVKVLDYAWQDIENHKRQKSTKEVKRIEFEKLDWLRLEPNLSSYQKIKLQDLLYNLDVGDPPFQNPNLTGTAHKPSGSHFEKEGESNPITAVKIYSPHNSNEPFIETLKTTFFVRFSEAQFMLGYVKFRRKIKEVNAEVDFKIPNEEMLPEFDHIKFWFAKKLKTKKFKVLASLITTNGEITEASATSPQIDLINADLIDSIKYQRTLSLTKAPRFSDLDKSLFTADEIFGEMESDEMEGNTFNQNETDILNALLEKYETRNRKQLEYLSGHKQSANRKIRFTLHPNFGFLFFIEGKENNHFVWELLNSHATYIWTIDKSEMNIELQYKRVEETINTIRDSGREQYKRAYKQNHHDLDLVFSVVEHEDISSNFVEGFVKWKHKLNERLT